VGLSRPLLRQARSRLFPCQSGRITGTLRVNESSVNFFEYVQQDDSGNKADARREDVVVETVKSGVNGSKDGKEKAIGLTIAQIERQFGKGAIMRLGAQPAALEIAVIPTGAISLDVALGVGGIPRGRVTEIFGPEASGKTTLALHLIAEVQQAGGIAAFIDAEHALDPVYAQKLGVKTDELLISQPDTGEQALEIAETLVRSGAIDVIVIDSVAALVPKAELDGEMGDAPMGMQARLMSQALRKLTGIISKSRTAMIFINQLRQKIGMFMGNPETTTGGNALKFYASVRLDVRRIAQIKDGDETTGSRVRVKVVKNKVAPPFRQAEFDMMYGEGISREGDLLDLASERGLIHKSGAWYAYQDDRIGQGRENAKKYLKEHPELTAAIAQQLRQTLGLTRVAAETPADTAADSDLWPLERDDEHA
jgi:recombination protein RecA